ncbi:MAG TPA: MBL fold metallo-hydrolase [Methanoculleus sp.]|jgi:hydroxyacylglutathione hydrolase|uniref:MBL fold metallo-hydrolase n=1 Tax=Methanoculleus sp. TaxID=90427 RepID=UPI001B439334|nr:MBL fold metallo-hydrolase [Methanoculleus sp.]MBP7143633.1 MBL fold metallo-hydrolase [Methanoculleus sp.]HQL58859.1 MBL fold metallo-hydrolase [Methanoculleus sp.]
MLFRKIKSDILAHNSYMIGADGEAAVIDPRRDCQVYTSVAGRRDMKIAAIFETHKNEDYVSGSRELARPTGAEILHGAREEFGFGTPVREGETFEFGSLEIEVLETPGHTVESISLLLRDRSVSDDPLMVFTGDALFAGDVGRTDLAGEDRRREMSEMLYESLHEKLLPLPDGVIACPAHGAGSVCGGNISDREYTSIGFERATNRLLSMGKEEFVEYKVNERLYEPPYFTMMRRLNKAGPPLIYNLPYLRPYTARELRSLLDRKAQVVDIRSPTGFAGGHVPGTINIWRNGLPLYVGYYLNYEDPIVLVDDFNLGMGHVLRHFVRLGYDNIGGYLAGGFPAWFKQGERIGRSGIWSPSDLAERLNDPSIYILDVRKITHREESGHIRGSHHIYVGNLEERIKEIPEDKEIVVHCDAGFKGSLAASILKKHGFRHVANLLGGTIGWEAANYPLVRD